jgi:hypothetical protein
MSAGSFILKSLMFTFGFKSYERDKKRELFFSKIQILNTKFKQTLINGTLDVIILYTAYPGIAVMEEKATNLYVFNELKRILMYYTVKNMFLSYHPMASAHGG